MFGELQKDELSYSVALQLNCDSGLRLMPVYTLNTTGVKIWIITEADPTENF